MLTGRAVQTSANRGVAAGNEIAYHPSRLGAENKVPTPSGICANGVTGVNSRKSC